MIIVDPIQHSRRKKFSSFCHMTSTLGELELVLFAYRLGLSRAYLQHHSNGWSHFDLVQSIREKAVATGAHEVELRAYVRKVAELGTGDRE